MSVNEEEKQSLAPESIPTEIERDVTVTEEETAVATDMPEEKVVETDMEPEQIVQGLLLQNQTTKQHSQEKITQNSTEWAHLTEEKPAKKPQFNQFPTYFYAGFWIRLWAYLFDLVCILSIRGIILSLIGFVISLNPLVSSGLGVLIYLGYFILLTKLNQGQTLGKLLFGLKVVCFNEKELSWPTVIVREGACRFIFQLGFLSVLYVVAAFTQKKQHIGDFMSDTSVLTLNQVKAYQGLEA